MSSTAESSQPKMLALMSSDGHVFQVEEAVACESIVVKNMIDEGWSSGAIPMKNVSGEILSKVIQFLKKNAEYRNLSTDDAEEEMKKWNAGFVDENKDSLSDLIMAAHYMDIKSLLDLTCKNVADMIKGKTPEELRVMFNKVNDFTPEEEEKMKRERKWGFDYL